MRITTKEVVHEVDGQEMTFQIRKMDALHGSYLMKFCAEKLLPVFNDVQKLFANDNEEGLSPEELEEIAKKRTDEVFTMLPKALANLSEEELIGFEMKCLRTVDVKKPAGLQPVLIGNNFGVEELEDDIKTILILCYEVVEFNMSGFFGEKGLGSLLPRRST